MKKKGITILLSLVLIFTMLPCGVVFGATKAPSDDDLKQIFEDLGFICQFTEDAYFSYDENVTPEAAYYYLHKSGKLERFFNDDTWCYELASSQYIKLVKNTFANYSQTEILNWLKTNGNYDAATGGRVSLSASFWLGGEYEWAPISIKKNNSVYTVEGLYLCGSEFTGDVTTSSKKFYDYWTYTGKDYDGMGNSYEWTAKMAIKDSLSVKLVNTDSGLKIAAFEEQDAYTYNGKTYYQNSNTGKFDQRFTFSLSTNKLVYTGKALTKPMVVVKNKNNQKVDAKSGYTLTWSKASVKDVGRYSVTVKLKKPYSGTKKLYFTVLPKAPASAKATLYGHDDVKFSWSKSTGATGYSVYYKKASAQNYTFLKRTTGTFVKVADLADGVKYSFKVVPYYKQNDVRYDSTKAKISTVYTLKKLGKPTAVKSQSKVKVSWKDISGESGYQVRKAKMKDGKYLTVQNYTTTKSSLSISATKGNTYYYRVRAYKTVGKEKVYGPWSEYVKYKL